ncbi:MAG TPA: hypothetical protein VGS97_05185 [Actinocrinis sp.]|uniref:hypothetical protein n=1 Tax=Actinocrinis sp. TaxID=1920516 RepID=UPI002DDD6D52|nr:hypothetical protein [Actinocrinis sp.]HEV2343467.1 hypothetical protein [Actinocrinis sp.]
MSKPNDAERRAQTIAALRDFADRVEIDPTIPTPTDVDIRVHLHSTRGTQAQRFAAVFDFAEQHGAPVTENPRGHRKTTKRFGPIDLTVLAFADKQNTAFGVVTRADDPALTAA